MEDIIYERVSKDSLKYFEFFLDCFPHLLEKIVSLEEYSSKLEAYGNILIFKKKYNVIGICCFYDNDEINKIGFISLIGIKKEFRNNGYGKKIIDIVKSLMKASKMNYIKLEVDDDNLNAINFYKCNGFNFLEKREKSSIYYYKL